VNGAPPPPSPQHSLDPPSPCISVCRMDPASGLCTGCYRTLDEIAQWGGASAAWKRTVWAQIRQRRNADQAPPST
jgi:uncharacterized protein